FQSLLEWFLGQRGKTIKGFTKTMYSGVTTNYLARLVSRLVTSHPALTGLYQVASQPISKHDLLVLVRKAYGLNVEIIPDEGDKTDRTLSGEKFLAKTGYETPSWPELVGELASDPTPYASWRS